MRFPWKQCCGSLPGDSQHSPVWHEQVPLPGPVAAQTEVLCTESERRSDKPLTQVTSAAACTRHMSEVTVLQDEFWGQLAHSLSPRGLASSPAVILECTSLGALKWRVKDSRENAAAGPGALRRQWALSPTAPCFLERGGPRSRAGRDVGWERGSGGLCLV